MLVLGICIHGLDCGLFRDQVLEETGYNIAAKIDPANVIELTIKEQRISLFIVPGVPEDFNFQTRTRKEISVWDFYVYLTFTHFAPANCMV